VIFEGFVTVDEDDWNFVGEAAAQFVVGFYVDVAPGEAATAFQLGQGFLDDFTKMAAFARVNDDLSQDIHGRSLAGLVIREKHLRPFKNQTAWTHFYSKNLGSGAAIYNLLYGA
jgi:hypothetical protein